MRIDLIPLTGTEILEFTPSELLEGFNPKPKVFIRVATFAMKDKMTAILFQRGFIPATTAQGRGILIDALYDLYDEAQANDEAAFLEEYWIKSEVHQELVQAWGMREAQRLFDVAHGVTGENGRKKLEQEPVPPAPYTMREQARQARLLTFALENSEAYRHFQARFMSADEEEKDIVMRLFIDGWSGADEAKPERDELDRLTPESIEGLRKWFAENGAHKAWDEVKAKVLQQFSASGGLEKNLGSPLDTNSNLTGSQIMSGDLETSGGSSTTSPTTPTPGSKSPSTSEGSRSLPSNSRGKGKTVGRKAGRTAKPS